MANHTCADTSSDCVCRFLPSCCQICAFDGAGFSWNRLLGGRLYQTGDLVRLVVLHGDVESHSVEHGRSSAATPASGRTRLVVVGRAQGFVPVQVPIRKGTSLETFSLRHAEAKPNVPPKAHITAHFATSQVKLDGVRVDVTEAESCISSHPDVSECRVVAVRLPVLFSERPSPMAALSQIRNDVAASEPGQRHTVLVAFVDWVDGAKNEHDCLRALADYAARTLPRFLLPPWPAGWCDVSFHGGFHRLRTSGKIDIGAHVRAFCVDFFSKNNAAGLDTSSSKFTLPEAERATIGHDKHAEVLWELCDCACRAFGARIFHSKAEPSAATPSNTNTQIRSFDLYAAAVEFGAASSLKLAEFAAHFARAFQIAMPFGVFRQLRRIGLLCDFIVQTREQGDEELKTRATILHADSTHGQAAKMSAGASENVVIRDAVFTGQTTRALGRAQTSCCRAMDQNVFFRREAAQLDSILWKMDLRKCIDASPLLVPLPSRGKGSVKPSPSERADEQWAVVIGSHAGIVKCCDAPSGKVIWTYHLPEHSRVEAPAIATPDGLERT